MKRDLLLLLSALVALTSCSKDDVVTTTDPQTTQISFTTEIKTRVSGSSFEAGDAVSVYAFDGATQYASAEYTYADSKFSSTNPITYIGDDEKSLSYTAVYPTVDDLAFSFEISGDQSKDENYYASDLLVANVAATTSAEPKLSFYHKMSSIVLNISVTQNGEAVTAGSSVEMYALNNVDCNAITDSYVATGSTTTITPAANGTSGYKFIIAPQDVKAGESFATLTVGDVTFDWIESKDLNFLSGNEYNYTWKVDLESKVSTITFEGMINDWNSGNDIDIVGGSNTEDDSALSIVLEGGNGMASSDETGTFETEGVTFAYYNACYNTYGSYAVNKNTDGYICNATALEGLSEVILTDDYSYFNFSLYVGSEAGVCTQKIEYTQEDGSDDRVFTIPEGYSFFTLVNETTYDANADKITILFESLGETSTVTPPATEEPEPADPNQYTCDSFLAAMGKTTDDINSSSGLNIVDAEFDNFTFTSDKGTATTAFRLWTDLTIRSYAGNTVTVTAKDGKMVKSIVFSASEISEATEGTADGKSWSGESSTVTLTLTKATNDSITIVVE